MASKKKLIECASGLVPADENVVVGVIGEATNPMYFIWFGLVGALLRRLEFFTLTDVSLHVSRVRKVSSKPYDITATYHRSAVVVTAPMHGFLWSSIRLYLPGVPDGARYYVMRVWRPELEQLVASLPAAPARPEHATD